MSKDIVQVGPLQRGRINLASVTYTSDTVAFLEKHLHLTGKEFYSRADIDAALSDLIDETVRADK